jgi:spore germination protein YaaH
MKRTFHILTVLILLPGLLLAAPLKNKGPLGLAGWVIFWDKDNQSLDVFEKHASVIDRVYFEWFKCGADGMPEAVKEATRELKARAMAAAKKGKCQTWFMIGNWSNEIMDHDAKRIQKFLYDPVLEMKHIAALIKIAKKEKVKGIQIDYENLKAADKDAFTAFMTHFAAACHKNKLLAGIAVHGKSDSVGTWDGPKAQDYEAIGKVVDEMVPMTYDQHWNTSTAGPIAAPEWTETIIRYATSAVGAGKVEEGVPTYGYDWKFNKGDTISWDQFKALCDKNNAQPVRDTDNSQELKLDYGDRHEAWIPDAQSFYPKADIAKRYKLAGVAVWYFGCEDPRFWDVFQKAATTTVALLPTGSGTADASGPKDFVTDSLPPSYTYVYPEPDSKIAVVEQNGRRWVDMTLKGDDWSGAGIGVDRKNLSAYLDKGALQFYIRGSKGGEMVDVGFVMEKGLTDDEKYDLQVTLPLAQYAQVTNGWTLVTIPLADFPKEGRRWDAASKQNVSGPFKWNRVLEFALNHAPGKDSKIGVQVASIRVLPSYDQAVVTPEKAKVSPTPQGK